MTDEQLADLAPRIENSNLLRIACELLQLARAGVFLYFIALLFGAYLQSASIIILHFRYCNNLKMVVIIDRKSITANKGDVLRIGQTCKKTLDEWRRDILNAAREIFISKGYEETSISYIMEMAGGAKGMFYRCFQSKEDVMHALGNQMFFENNPFDAIKERNDLNGLQKIRLLLVLNQSDDERNYMNMQAISILKDPHILAAAVEQNRRVLIHLWLELLEEGKNDGSIKTEYVKELSELLPLINFWLMPTVFLATEEELRHKYHFVMEMLDHMGLPIFDDEAISFTEKFIADISEKGGNEL